jgi:4-hydroxy-tetrahydrodipicolinate reductase
MEPAEMIKVLVVGAGGKMGEAVCAAVLADPELSLVGAVDKLAAGRRVNGAADLTIGADLDEGMTAGPDVVVDFTTAEAVAANAEAAAKHGAHLVIGTTGLSATDIDGLIELTNKYGKNIILAPNFALGAVIMMKISERIAGYFDRAEIIEFHHDQKVDAPSGTALMTAEMMAGKIEARPLVETEKFAGARGARVRDVPIHSVRLPGLVAHQEVIFGLKGQTLTIRHDSIDRGSFMPGVVLAVKEIGSRPGFTHGLDKLLDL